MSFDRECEKDELKRMIHSFGIRTVTNLLASSLEELASTNTIYLDRIEPDDRLSKEDIKTVVANLRKDLF